MRVTMRLGLCALLLVAGCARKKENAAVSADTLTQRQRDSILARQPIPGAKVVGKALDASDAAAAHNAAIDSAQGN